MYAWGFKIEETSKIYIYVNIVVPQTQSGIPQSDNNISSSFLPVILWVKAYVNENAKAWENENALFSSTSENLSD